MQTKQDKAMIRKITHYHVREIRRCRMERKSAQGHELNLMRLIACRHDVVFDFSLPIPVPMIPRPLQMTQG